MTALNFPVAFLPMARKETAEKTQQVNFRLKTSTLERMERFRESDEIRPSLTQIVEASVAKWLDAKEAEHASKRKPSR